MNAIVMAAAHAMKLGAIPLPLTISSPSKDHERYWKSIKAQVSLMNQKAEKWIVEGNPIVLELRQACINAASSGSAIDLYPLISSLDNMIENHISHTRENIKQFRKLRQNARIIDRETYRQVNEITDELIALLNKETNALSDTGLVWRALQHEYGQAQTGPSDTITDPTQLDSLLSH